MGQDREQSEIATDKCSRVQPKLPGTAATAPAGPCWEVLLLGLADRAMKKREGLQTMYAPYYDGGPEERRPRRPTLAMVEAHDHLGRQPHEQLRRAQQPRPSCRELLVWLRAVTVNVYPCLSCLCCLCLCYLSRLYLVVRHIVQ